MCQNRIERIEHLLANCLEFKAYQIINQSDLHRTHVQSPQSGQSHFLLKLELDPSCKLNVIQIHRKVYQLLDTEFESGLHALSIEII